ncbi:MAG: cupin domain-containing protein [Ferruginibacter sp.]|nr:cupin domain-containing protein [Cytophagales bacterium]
MGDKITFLKTARETGGRSSLLQLELAPLAQGTPPHYHERFTETFTVQEGELIVRCSDEIKKLGPGQSFTVPINTKHCFFNTKETPVKALIELNPGSEGFENGLKIAYGLARDGQCSAKGLPKRLDYLALLFDMSEGRMPGLLSLMMPIFRMVARKARAKGVEKELIEKYC